MTFSRRVAPSMMVALSLIISACAGGPSPRKGPTLPVSTGEERPFVRDPLAPPTEVSPLFDAARKAFREGKFDVAAQRFAAYRKEAPPGDPLTDNALFGEGLAHFDQGRYDEAGKRFAALVAQWPDAETAPAAMINLAICRYWTGAWKEANDLLKKSAKLTTRPAQMAYIAYYRAALSERNGDFFEAALRAIDAERLAEDRELVTLAREKVERLFHTFLSDAELEGFTQSFAGRWPAKGAWEELLVRYRRTGQEEKLERAKRALVSDFADEGAVAGKLLADENAVISHPRIVVALPVAGAGSDVGRRMFQGAQLAANDYHELIRQLDVDMTMKDMGQTLESARLGVQESALDRSTIALLGPVGSARSMRSPPPPTTMERR